ncbi:MAG: serine hydrolase domain-containing protein, partial [Bacteroidota bacterium]
NLEKQKSVNPKESLFRVASISKCITGLALGKMVEEGILHWDDSFYKYVPHYPKKKYDFTLRQLASHTAGIRGYRGKEFALNQPYSIEKGIGVFKNDPLLFEPGKGYMYNSFDFVLLSLAMQKASGIPFEEYVKKEVLNPLGMRTTYTPLEISNQLDLNISEFYSKRTSGFSKAIEVDNFYKLAGGGYLSTSEDIAKMGQVIMEKQHLKKESYDQLFLPQIINGTATYYGIGFQVSQDAQGKSFIGHVGNSVGAYTNFFVYPKEQVVISILMNCTDPSVQDKLDKVIAAVNAPRNPSI